MSEFEFRTHSPVWVEALCAVLRKYDEVQTWVAPLGPLNHGSNALAVVQHILGGGAEKQRGKHMFECANACGSVQGIDV